MRPIAKLLVLCFILTIVMTVGAALADSPSKQDCEASGGTFTRVMGTVTCTISDPVGQSEHSGGQSQNTTDKESSQGTLQNAPQHQESCTGPGGSGDNGGPCKK